VRAPAVSVLLPVRDAAPTLSAALRSIALQTDRDWECVLVDDGSSDATGDIIDRAAQRDPRFRALHTPPRGIVAALSTGLEACRGKYVARMDGDDRMHRTRLHRQRAAVERDANLAGVGCHVRLFPRPHLSAGRLAYEAWLNSLRTEADVLRDRFVECPIAHPTLFARRELLLRYGYRDVGWPEDYDLVLRLLADGHALGMVPEALLAWRDGPGRLSRTHPAYALQRFVDCKAAFLAETWLESPGYVLWGYGDTGRTLCKALARLGRHPTHIVELHPGRVGQRVAGAPVIRPEALTELVPRPSRIVVSVATLGARSEIRAALAAMKFAEGRDYVCAA
jgi:glycosyltransferase involved in cell wall biosynthesis